MDYSQYRNLPKSEKQRKIKNAKSDEKDRCPHPLGNDVFPDQNFIEFTVLQDSKQIKLHTYRYKSNLVKPKALVFIFHGLNAHIGQGAHLARLFSENGYQTIGFDHRGFGKSQGQPGYVESFEQHMSDSIQFIELVINKYRKDHCQTFKIFGLGLSMGGMTVYHLALKNPKLFNSVILMAPALIHNLPSFVPKFTSLISKILPKSTRLIPPLADKSNKNPNVTEYRKKDPNCFTKRASLSTMNFIVSVMNASQQTFSEFSCPFMVVQGGIDKLVNPEVAFKLYDNSKVPKQEKKLLFYENMWHGIWHENEIWQIIDECIVWFNKRLGNKKQKEQQEIGK